MMAIRVPESSSTRQYLTSVAGRLTVDIDGLPPCASDMSTLANIRNAGSYSSLRDRSCNHLQCVYSNSDWPQRLAVDPQCSVATSWPILTKEQHAGIIEEQTTYELSRCGRLQSVARSSASLRY